MVLYLLISIRAFILSCMSFSFICWTCALTNLPLFCKPLVEGAGMFALNINWLSALFTTGVCIRPICIPKLTLATLRPGRFVGGSISSYNLNFLEV